MEVIVPDLLTLPRRPYNQPPNFSKYSTKTCLTNFYEIDLNGKRNQFYQYSFEVKPEVPTNSKDILQKVIRSIKQQTKDNLDVNAWSGNVLWGSKQMSIPLNIKSEFVFEERTHKFDVIIKLVQTLSLKFFQKTTNGQKIVKGIINNRIKQVLCQKGMDKFDRSRYFNQKESRFEEVEDIGLCVIRGYKLTLYTLESAIYLQVSLCSMIHRSKSLLEELSTQQSKDYAESLVGSSVITTYGRRRTYKIERICYDMSPLSKFWHEQRACEVTFAQYYGTSYGLVVLDTKQPLIEVILKKQKKSEQRGIIKEAVKGFLIPQFVCLTGTSEEKQTNFTSRYSRNLTKLYLNSRAQLTSDIINVLHSSEQLRLTRQGKPQQITGYRLMLPTIIGQNGEDITNHSYDQVYNKLKNSLDFNNWFLVYSCGKYPYQDTEQAQELVSNIQWISRLFGIKWEDPDFITCDGKKNSQIQWKQQIQKACQKNGKPQIIVLYFKPSEESFYGSLKRFISCEIKIPCQVIRRQTISDHQRNTLMIIIQMNQKIGGTAWQVIPQKDGYASQKKVMYGSIVIAKGKKGFTLAFTGTTDNSLTKVWTYAKVGYKSIESIPQADFETIFSTWANNYVLANEEGPTLILIYREGFSMQQLQRRVKPQIDALYSVIKKVGNKIKVPNYAPEVVYVNVNTKTNTRIYDFQGKYRTGQSNIQVPQIYPSRSGRVVFGNLTIDKQYDFHLIAHEVKDGTCRPVHYMVVHDSSKMPQEQLAQFTYEQCFNYYNWPNWPKWPDAMKVPGMLQCAKKLAELVGEHIQEDVTQGDLLSTFYFL